MNNEECYNNRRPIPDSKLTKTLDELTDRFGGSSSDESSIEGKWVETIAANKVYYKDRGRLLWLVCDDSSENRTFFIEYNKKLKERFRQRSIYMIITVESLI
jgi:hypothetical protein